MKLVFEHPLQCGAEWSDDSVRFRLFIAEADGIADSITLDMTMDDAKQLSSCLQVALSNGKVPAERVQFSEGVTVAELQRILNNYPKKDLYGHDHQVVVSTGLSLFAPILGVAPLDDTVGGSMLILKINSPDPVSSAMMDLGNIVEDARENYRALHKNILQARGLLEPQVPEPLDESTKRGLLRAAKSIKSELQDLLPRGPQ